MEGVFEPEEISIAAKENFPVVFHSKQQIDWLHQYSANTHVFKPLHAWIKIDTGMGRLGFGLSEVSKVYEYLATNTHIAKPIGIMSHLACADDFSHRLNVQQINSFNNFIKTPQIIKHKNLKSLCNSAGIFNFPSEHYDVIRPGLALYGVSPILNRSAQELGLKPVMTLQTKIIAIKKLPKNSTVGYGARFTCPLDLNIAVIAMGYGDGYPRTAIDGMPVLINGQRCPIIGRVSMDMSVVDLKNCPDAKIGDPVVLWGNNLPIEEVAKFTQNSVYDLLTSMQNRVKFCWD